MGSIGSAGNSASTTKELTNTEYLVSKIAGTIEGWIADSYMDDDDKESVTDYHSLLESLDLTASEAREYIMEDLEERAWDWINRRPGASERDLTTTFDDDGQFEDESGNFLKYKDVMKLVKKELVNRNILKVAR